MKPRLALLHGAMAAVGHMETVDEAAAGIVAAGDEEIAAMAMIGDGLIVVRVMVAVASAPPQKVRAEHEDHVKATAYAAPESARGIDLDVAGKLTCEILAVGACEGDDGNLNGTAALPLTQRVYPPGVGDQTVQELAVIVRAGLVIVKTHVAAMLTVALQCGEHAALKWI